MYFCKVYPAYTSSKLCEFIGTQSYKQWKWIVEHLCTPSLASEKRQDFFVTFSANSIFLTQARMILAARTPLEKTLSLTDQGSVKHFESRQGGASCGRLASKGLREASPESWVLGPQSPHYKCAVFFKIRKHCISVIWFLKTIFAGQKQFSRHLCHECREKLNIRTLILFAGNLCQPESRWKMNY